MTMALVTSKDTEFVQFLLNATQTGKTRWEPTAQPDEFTTTFRGSYTVSVSKPGSSAQLVLADTSDQRLLVLTESDLGDVAILYEYVRRTSLQVDYVIDQIITADDLVVIEAKYGVRDHRVDVTAALNAKIAAGKLHIYVGNQLAGDPAPNTEKDLVVKYKYKGQELEKTAVEGGTLVLP